MSAAAAPLRAQNILSVPFTNGFIGATGSNAGQSNNVQSFAAYGIARIFFIQNSTTTEFQIQGNDIAGTIRFVGTNGSTLDIPGAAVWRQNNGATTYLVGFVPQISGTLTWNYGAGQTLTITNGETTGGTNIGAYFNSYAGPFATSGNESGNAAKSGVLQGLNQYLGTVNGARPSGPVTVTPTTAGTSDNPINIGGTVTLQAGENLTVVVNGVEYSTATSPALQISGGNWTLALPGPLSTGVYQVVATITNAAGYTLSDASSNELTVGAGASPITIAAGGTFTARSKVYDGTTAATIDLNNLSLTGSPANVFISSVTLAFQTAAAGTGKTVVITGFTLGGSAASSYTPDLTGAPEYTSGVITAAPLTITGVTANNKIYNGTTAATLTGTPAYSGLVNGETFAVTGTPSATFVDANVGTGKAVTVTNYTAPNANYSLTQPAGLTANITPKELTIGGSFTANNKPYDGNVTATIATNTLSLTGVVAGDVGNVTLTGLTAAFADAAVGNGKLVSLTAASLAGSANGNYTVTVSGAPTTTANITAAPLTIGGSFTANDKVYDALVAATGNTAGLTLSGSPAGVTIASVTLAFQTATVGTGKTVVITGLTLGGANAGLYTVNLTGAPTATAAITPKALTITGITPVARSYNRTTTITLSGTPAYQGLVNGETFAVTGTPSATVTTPDVGVAKPVTITGYTAPNGNYTVTQPTGLTVNITPATITIGGSFTAANKAFDGNTSATMVMNSLALVGVFAPDVVTLATVNVAFDSPSAGNGKTVSILGATLGGANASNYALSLAGAPTALANITATVLTLGGTFTANDKIYDGTVAATGNTAGLTLAGVPLGAQVSIGSVTLAFQSAPVGTGKTVVVTGVTLTGANAGNYAVNLASAPTALAAITPRPVTIAGSFTAADKLFDGNTSATILTSSFRVNGAIGGDVLTVSSATAVFATPEAGTGRVVSLSAVSLAGSNASNYMVSLAGAPTTTASILAIVPPGPPRNLRGTAGDKQLTITFELPEQEGCRNVTSYVLEYSTDNGATWTRQAVPGRTPGAVTIAPVANNLTYRVRVAAVNDCGMGPWVEIGSLTPIGPARDGNGAPRTNTPGTTTVTTDGANVPTTITVVQDTTVRVTGPDFTISLRGADTTGAPIPADGLTLQLEQGGRATAEGTGFGPGTWVTIYIYSANGTPRLLGQVLVQPDGTFRTAFPIPADLAPGPYTLQVNGVDASRRPRTATVGVEVVEPAPELIFTAVPDRNEMTVGETVIFTLTVTNTGRGPAIDVVIPRAFDEPGFRFVAATPIDGRFEASTLTWTIPRIAAGGTARLTLRAVVLPPPAPTPAPETNGDASR